MYCTFSKKLYISRGILHPNLVKWKLRHGAGQLTIFVVARAAAKQDQLDILHAVNLKQRYYRRHPVHIYGLAASYRGAMRILEQIARESVAKGYGGDFRRFLSDREKGM